MRPGVHRGLPLGKPAPILAMRVKEGERTVSIFDPTTLVGLHSLVSVLSLLAGIVVVVALLGGRDVPGTRRIFVVTAVATSASGFVLPATMILPSHIVAVVALLVLAVVIVARRAAWTRVHALALVASLWFLVFVAIAQSFAKVPALKALAPTQSEPPFAIVQLVVLALFVALGWAAARNARR